LHRPATAKTDSEHGTEAQQQQQSQQQDNGTTVTSGFSTESSLPEADDGVIVAPPAAATAVETDEYPAEIIPETGEGVSSASAGAGVPMVDSSGSIHNDEDSDEEEHETQRRDAPSFSFSSIIHFAASRAPLYRQKTLQRRLVRFASRRREEEGDSRKTTASEVREPHAMGQIHRLVATLVQNGIRAVRTSILFGEPESDSGMGIKQPDCMY
jgi:hypothetical protein